MDVNEQRSIETGFQDLLSGRLGGSAAGDLLARVGRDEDARRILLEMIRVQDLSRRCLGLDVDERAIGDGLARTLSALGESASGQTSPQRRRQGRSWRRWGRRAAWPMRAAAGLLIAASLMMAYLAHQDNRSLHRQLSELSRPPAGVVVPDVRAEDVDKLRTLWGQVAQGSGGARPWVLLSDGVGQFGYLPAEPGAAGGEVAGGGPVLVRCVIVTEGQPAKQIDVVLAGRASAPLAVSRAARVLGRPVDIAVWAVDNRVQVDLKAGASGDELAGLRGSVRIDHGRVEVGRFRLDGRVLRLFLQAIRMNGKTA